MRIIAIIAVILSVWTGPALAQAAPDASRVQHLNLAERYLELTQGGDVLKQLRRQLEESFGESDMPSEQRDWMADNMTTLFEQVVEATITEMSDEVADSFTVEELEAAIAFYESPVGRSVILKQVDMNAEIQEAMMPHLMPGMTSLMEKFCIRFDCAALGAAAAKTQQ